MKEKRRLTPLLLRALCTLMAVVFLVIEGWLLFAGDWRLFENTGLAFVQALCRSFLALLAVYVGFSTILWKKRKNTGLVWGLLASALVSVPFLSNGAGWIPVMLAGVFLLAGILDGRKKA